MSRVSIGVPSISTQRQTKSREGGRGDLKPSDAAQRVRLPPGKGVARGRLSYLERPGHRRCRGGQWESQARAPCHRRNAPLSGNRAPEPQSVIAVVGGLAARRVEIYLGAGVSPHRRSQPPDNTNRLPVIPKVSTSSACRQGPRSRRSRGRQVRAAPLRVHQVGARARPAAPAV